MEKNIPPLINDPLRSKRYGSVTFIFVVILIAGIRPLRIFGDWVYLYDSKGNGPLNPLKLPKNIKDLDDDPFRSLAWAVRERGGFQKTDEPFAEFRWANFFRSKFPAGNANSNMERLIQEALKLCRTPAATGLPGYYSGTDQAPVP